MLCGVTVCIQNDLLVLGNRAQSEMKGKYDSPVVEEKQSHLDKHHRMSLNQGV